MPNKYEGGDDGVEMVSKSRRGQIGQKALNEDDIQEDINIFKPPPPVSYGYGEIMFTVAQGVAILLWGLYCEYGEGTHPGSKMSEADARDHVQNLYPFFQDVHVMIYIGFGFLMTFLKTSSWSALCFNWIISIWAFQWAILSTGFWHQIVGGKEKISKINIGIESLIAGDFGAGAAMITFGAILGKTNLQQLFFLVFWEMIFYGLNEAILVEKFGVMDIGGSMVIHTFGAYYGCAACYFFQPTRASKSNNMKSSYQSEMIAVIGSIFLWMYWPSFNGALASGVQQQRTVCNTVLGIGGSCVGAACIARWLFGKLEMEIMLNATLAGGVAVGSAADLFTSPWEAMLVGFIGGVVSAVGF